eukprot:2367573-Heterocapsa_arctica.AAC.1
MPQCCTDCCGSGINEAACSGLRPAPPVQFALLLPSGRSTLGSARAGAGHGVLLLSRTHAPWLAPLPLPAPGPG